MSIREIAERHADEYYEGPGWRPTFLTEIIERAIREAAAPLVEALEMAEHLLDDDPAIHAVIVAALAEWRKSE